MIRKARPEDLRRIQDIEVAAGELFRGIGMDAISEAPPPSVDELMAYQRAGRAWVATDPADHPIAYILVDIVEGRAHIEQVTVHPRHSRKGLGSGLVDHVTLWAREMAFSALTLTTFRDVPWNAPYYERLVSGSFLKRNGLTAFGKSCNAKTSTGWPSGRAQSSSKTFSSQRHGLTAANRTVGRQGEAPERPP